MIKKAASFVAAAAALSRGIVEIRRFMLSRAQAKEEHQGNVMDIPTADGDVLVCKRVPSEGRAAAAHLANGESDQPAANDDLRQLTRDELYQKAKALEIPGRSAMRKDELVDALSDAL